MMQVTVAFNHFGKGLVQRMPLRLLPRAEQRLHALADVRHRRQPRPNHHQPGEPVHRARRPQRKEVTKREYAPYNEYKDWVWKS
uniref:Uncharacterized protein n=1 Tax=Hordeum vulgare subsp. vulgare TaxID=112509 RepID=A0A8I6Y1R5_HORVV